MLLQFAFLMSYCNTQNECFYEYYNTLHLGEIFKLVANQVNYIQYHNLVFGHVDGKDENQFSFDINKVCEKYERSEICLQNCKNNTANAEISDNSNKMLETTEAVEEKMIIKKDICK